MSTTRFITCSTALDRTNSTRTSRFGHSINATFAGHLKLQIAVCSTTVVDSCLFNYGTLIFLRLCPIWRSGHVNVGLLPLSVTQISTLFFHCIDGTSLDLLSKIFSTSSRWRWFCICSYGHGLFLGPFFGRPTNWWLKLPFSFGTMCTILDGLMLRGKDKLAIHDRLKCPRLSMCSSCSYGNSILKICIWLITKMARNWWEICRHFGDLLACNKQTLQNGVL